MNFYERLHIVCNQIPYGTVATYGQLALLCGKSKNSRREQAAGWVSVISLVLVCVGIYVVNSGKRE